ncbi:MAG: diaminopimelate decarboxylase [Pelagibacterales bacterium]|nr:diaminopimelate decarboxylase [Pelagibacterales bacterium]PPR15922.1 MAG: Diaminopimelate decarboxylase [Alphaproteobacteria bacterium MarineAlpha9_Bin3]|tara:strand:- start:1207 stop:2475 length:1269 start_codon:yes stop_codon:yes gene_type:complete
MTNFSYKNGILHIDDISVIDVEKKCKTPVYIYSESRLISNFMKLENALNLILGKNQSKLIAYSVKSNSNIAVINILKKLNSGADVVSSGELKRALKAGIKGEKIVFSGVGKTNEDLSLALDSKVLQFNVESLAELENLSKIAVKKNMIAPIAFRINPDIDAGGHAKISTGGSNTKFGIPYDRAIDSYSYAKKLPGINVVGIDIHIGSQITELEPFELAFDKVVLLYNKLIDAGHNILNIDLGGGIGVSYDKTIEPFLIKDYAELVKEKFHSINCKLIFEPGRYITANAGILLTKVVRKKESYNNNFIVVDAAMNDILRPALYDAHHEIIKVEEIDSKKEMIEYQVVGPICETGDILNKKVIMNDVKEDDLLAIKLAGAYGAVMSSQYNSRDLIPEVMISDNKINTIRKRITIEDFLSFEVIL